jgi:hypothetical protein
VRKNVLPVKAFLGTFGSQTAPKGLKVAQTMQPFGTILRSFYVIFAIFCGIFAFFDENG